MAKIARKTKRYPSDLTDEEWERIAPLMPKPGRRGRPREIEFREVINAVRYLVRSGCGWRMLPVDFGHWRTVYGWFRELARRFLFQTIHDIELMLDRERQGREASPSAAVIDSQSVKAPHGETRGYDAGKKINGRKRHALVDTDGRILLAQRPEEKSLAGLWEFPGGKVEEGETPESALIRELEEELGVSTKSACLAPLSFVSHSYESFHLLMPLYVCRKWQGIPQPREHAALKWVRPQALRDYPMPPADGPLIAPLCDLL